MSVCCECCVLSGRGLCDELITRPEESYRVWCVVMCDIEKQTPWMRRPRPTRGAIVPKKNEILDIKNCCLGYVSVYTHTWLWYVTALLMRKLASFTCYPKPCSCHVVCQRMQVFLNDKSAMLLVVINKRPHVFHDFTSMFWQTLKSSFTCQSSLRF